MRYVFNALKTLPDAELPMTSVANRARSLIEACPRYRPTPLQTVEGSKLGVPGLTVSVKDESGRFALGSFKALGGNYAVLCSIEDRLMDGRCLPEAFGTAAWRTVAGSITFTCATDGNHGRAVAAGARLAGSRCVIFVHASVAAHRVAAIRAFGAEVRVVDGHYDAAVAAADEAARTNGWVLASDTSYPGCDVIPRLVVEGYSVLVDEAIEAVAQHSASSGLTHVFVQAGVGGLAAAVALRMRTRLGDRSPALIVVEPDQADCLYQTAVAGSIASARGSLDTAMTMLACRDPSHDAWAILRDEAAAFITVSDPEASQAAALLGIQGLATSPSGAAGLAGLKAACGDSALRNTLALDGAHVLVIMTEGPNDRDDAFLNSGEVPQ
jgi:diaminopropionate ammonia-lyase